MSLSESPSQPQAPNTLTKIVARLALAVSLSVSALLGAACKKDPQETLQGIPDVNQRNILQSASNGADISADIVRTALEEGYSSRLDYLYKHIALLGPVTNKMEEILKNDALWQARLEAFKNNQVTQEDGDTAALYRSITESPQVRDLTNDQAFLLMAIIMQETGLRSRLTSHVGAQGWIQAYTLTKRQIRDGSWQTKYPRGSGQQADIDALVRRFSENLKELETQNYLAYAITDVDARENIALLLAYLQWKQEKLKGSETQIIETVMSYNGSIGPILRHQGDVASMLGSVLAETRNYGPAVLAYHVYLEACATRAVRDARAAIRPLDSIEQDYQRNVDAARREQDAALYAQALREAEEKRQRDLRDRSEAIDALPRIMRETMVAVAMERFTTINLGYRLIQSPTMVRAAEDGRGIVGTAIQGATTPFEPSGMKQQEAAAKAQVDRPSDPEQGWGSRAWEYLFGRSSAASAPDQQSPSSTAARAGKYVASQQSGQPTGDQSSGRQYPQPREFRSVSLPKGQPTPWPPPPNVDPRGRAPQLPSPPRIEADAYGHEMPSCDIERRGNGKMARMFSSKSALLYVWSEENDEPPRGPISYREESAAYYFYPKNR